MHISPDDERQQVWREKYPTEVGVLLSAFEMVLTMVILGCEIGGNFVHFPRMNVFLGYWTLPFFMCAWISLASTSCCCRIRCCGITALVFQCLAIPIALCGIGFTAHFLNYPTQCYFSNNCGSDAYYSYSDYYGLLNTTTLYNIKVPLTRAQLAASVLMFVSCVIYIVIFAITTYRVSKIIAPFQENLSRPIDGIPVPNGYDGLLPTSSVYGTVIIENLMQPFGFAPVSPFTKQLTCENCKFSFLATYQPPQPLPSL